ncbi:MAG: hypothetical protein KF796_19685 [Ramlibacter sp.]|nr:hypothetical protein [Ramlibacter sp.]
MTITIAFYKGRLAENDHALLFDRLTCWRTRSRFSHCELVLPEPSGGQKCWSSSFRDHGVRGKAVDLTTGRWVLIKVPGVSADTASAWFKAHVGAPYDWFGLLGWVFPWRVSNRAWWFCSEACAEAMGLEESWHISPGDLYQLALHMDGWEVAP